jgi:hypothetical protein
MSSGRITGFTVGFVVKVTLAAAIGFWLLKFLAKKVNVPGLSNAVQAL